MNLEKNLKNSLKKGNHDISLEKSKTFVKILKNLKIWKNNYHLATKSLFEFKCDFLLLFDFSKTTTFYFLYETHRFTT